MSTLVHALLRRPRRLLAVCLDASDENAAVLLQPLEELHPKLRAPFEDVLAAWFRLARARPTAPEVREDAARVCGATILDRQARLPPRRLPVPTPARDLRPWLCSPHLCPRLLAPEGRPPPPADTYYLHHHERAGGPWTPRLPEGFRRLVVPALSGQPWRTVTRALGNWYALGLPGGGLVDAEYARIMGVLAVKIRGRALAEWLAWLAACPPAHRADVAKGVAALGSGVPRPGTLPSGFLDYLAGAEGQNTVGYRVGAVLNGLRSGVDTERIQLGMELAAAAGPFWWELDGAPGPSPDRARLTGLLVGLPEEPGHGRSPRSRAAAQAFRIWKWYPERPETDRLLEAVPWEELETAEVPILLEAVGGCRRPERWTPSLRRSLWLRHVRRFPELLQLREELRGVPVRARILALEEIMEVWNRTRRDLEWEERTRPAVLELGRRLAHSVRREERVYSDLFHRLLRGLSGRVSDLAARLRTLPDRCFRELDREACCARNRWRTGYGLEGLAERAPEVLLGALGSRPEAAIRAARMLGNLRFRTRQGVLRRWLGHPLMVRRLPDRPTRGALRAVDRLVPPGGADPFSRRLREHARGERTLSPGSLRGHLERLRARLDGTRLEALESLALDALARAFPHSDPRQEGVRHALVFAHLCEDNRESLRNLLRATWSGREDFVLAHPRSRSWLDDHPGLPGKRWWEGIRRRVRTRSGRVLQLSVERDPVEVLRSGTYVGSCTALGGSYMDSAAGLAVDVNKAVVYARDSRGRVVGRQILGVSRETRLIPYVVYPCNAGEELRRAFRDFDRAFASVLGIPLGSREDGAGATVERVLSTYWMDDGEWDQKIKESD